MKPEKTVFLVTLTRTYTEHARTTVKVDANTVEEARSTIEQQMEDGELEDWEMDWEIHDYEPNDDIEIESIEKKESK